MAVSVDLVTGSTGSLQVLCCEAFPGQTFLFGDGNQWADVTEAMAIVPTNVGTVLIDTETGTISLYSGTELQNDVPPCCDIGSYPSGNRVVMANFKSVGDGGSPGGSLIVYEVDE
jgi:hypothetical protein